MPPRIGHGRRVIHHAGEPQDACFKTDIELFDFAGLKRHRQFHRGHIIGHTNDEIAGAR